MITSLHIQGYRGFEQFDMAGLGRLNLLVGTNNSGKTSVLEAIHLLTSRGDPMSLWRLLWRRGERVPGTSNPKSPQAELDVGHLFTGHETHIGSSFTLSAKNQSPERSVSFSIGELTSKERHQIVEEGPGPIPSRFVLHIKGNPPPAVASLPLTRSLGIVPDVLDSPPRRLRRRGGNGEEGQSQFITTDSLDGDDLVMLWDKVALTPSEDFVLEALRFLDPNIERIAAQATTPNYYGGQFRGGFIIKIRGHEHPIPIGSMGDGMWRLLAMAIAITQCKGGVLLIDEIDTGLHYTVMSAMWRLLYGAANELDVQVFATTHSFDCIQSLANICTNTTPENRVTLQRIEVGKAKAIQYSEDEIRAAAETHIEVR